MQAVASGERRALQVALQKRLATALAEADCRPRELAELSRQIRDGTREIEDIDIIAAEREKEAADDGAEAWDPGLL